MNSILDCIPQGKENAIPAAKLAEQLGVSSNRALRAYITGLRINGEVICSSAEGYYIPASREEILDYVRRMERQAQGTFRGIRSARDALKLSEGQQGLTLD